MQLFYLYFSAFYAISHIGISMRRRSLVYKCQNGGEIRCLHLQGIKVISNLIYERQIEQFLKYDDWFP
jgi:hypothetical protein